MLYKSNSNNYVFSVQTSRHKRDVLLSHFNITDNYIPPNLSIPENNNKIYCWNINDTFGDKGLTAITIPNVYMSSKLFADGGHRVLNEFNIMFSNLLDSLTDYDIDIILYFCKYEKNVDITKILELYNQNVRICKDSNFIMARGKKSKESTHFYKKWDYSVPMLCNNNKKSKYTSIFCNELLQCNLTETLHQNSLFVKSCHSASKYRIRLDDCGQLTSYVSKKHIDNNYGYCSKCVTWTLNEDVHTEYDDIMDFYGYSSVCHSCYDDLNRFYLIDKAKKFIRSYGYKPTPTFHYLADKYDSLKKKGGLLISHLATTSNATLKAIRGQLFVGLEVEIEARNGKASDERFLTAMNITEDSDGLFYCKDDGSIADEYDGFEIVSHPITPKALKRIDLKNILFKHSNNFKSFYGKNCGMHIHVNRSAFGKLQLVDFARLINDNKGLTHFVSQRKRFSEYSSWCDFGDSFTKNLVTELSYEAKYEKNKKMNQFPKTRHGQRYQVVNLRNRATVEIRSFKGNLSELGFRKNIDFVEAVFYFTKSKNCKITAVNFVDYVLANRKQFPSLFQYFTDNKNELDLILQNPNEFLIK